MQTKSVTFAMGDVRRCAHMLLTDHVCVIGMLDRLNESLFLRCRDLII